MKHSARDFVDGLRDVLPEHFPEGSLYGGAWTSWMFAQLHALAERLDLGCCCTNGGHGKAFDRAGKRDGLHREYLFDMTWYDNWGAWAQPDVIIEHENLWSKDEFLLDQWKLMVGFAPLRVGNR